MSLWLLCQSRLHNTVTIHSLCCWFSLVHYNNINLRSKSHAVFDVSVACLHLKHESWRLSCPLCMHVKVLGIVPMHESVLIDNRSFIHPSLSIRSLIKDPPRPWMSVHALILILRQSGMSSLKQGGKHDATFPF